MQKSSIITKLERAIDERVLVMDGSTGVGLRHLCPHDSSCDLLSLSLPEAVAELHRSYLEAGADIIETNTFNATTVAQGAYGMADRADEMNLAAASLAREEADRYMTEHRGETKFVAGAIGPTHIAVSKIADCAERDTIFARLTETFRRQATALIAGGVDMLAIETIYDMLSGRASVKGVTQAIAESGRDVPYTLSVTLSATTGLMPSGHSVDEFLASVDDARPLAAGFNCCEGPALLLAPLRKLAACSPFRTIVYPNAGLPDRDGRYPVGPAEFADAVSVMLDERLINIVGGCCGTGPEHIRRLRKAVDRSPAPHKPTAALAQ